jgi:hypothetical protein
MGAYGLAREEYASYRDPQEGTCEKQQQRHEECPFPHSILAITLPFSQFQKRSRTNVGEKSRFLEKWDIAMCTPTSTLARDERFLPDIAATVL